MTSFNLDQTIDHLFRREAGKMTSVLTKILGKQNLELAEDIVQETLLRAYELWKIKGLPEKPSAWLMQVAKNKAIDTIRREKHRRDFAKETTILLKSEYTLRYTIDKLTEENEIKDDLLRMMFACCHPAISEEAQLSMILKILCGFSTAEIAKAFISNEETITKRLYRAKQQFREEKIHLAIPSLEEINERLDSVLSAIYLLFNEGYNSTEYDSLIRQDLVEEALRLALLLTENTQTALPQVFALLALICFHTSRFKSRVDEQSNLLTLKYQNRTLWDAALIQRGVFFLQKSSQGQTVSRYHIEAVIAYEHCIAPSYEATNWQKILTMYDWLYQLENDPIVALNRSVVITEIHGARAGIKAIEQIPNLSLLKKFYLLPAILGELYARLGERQTAQKYWAEALSLTNSKAEKAFLEKKIQGVEYVM